MSRRSRVRRKRARSTIRDTRETPRALHHGDRRARSYPGVHELLAASSGAAWRDWLESALRGVLRPAAIVSAVGIAAGCGGGATATGTPGATLTTDTTTVQSSSSSTSPTVTTGATLVPLGTGSGLVVAGKLPPSGTSTPPSPLHGTPNVVPIPHPIAVRGEAVAVDPTPTTLPTPDAVPLGGTPVPMQITPPPPPPPTQHHHQQQQQAHPQPDPTPMPGGIAPVMPPPPPTDAPQS